MGINQPKNVKQKMTGRKLRGAVKLRKGVNRGLFAYDDAFIVSIVEEEFWKLGVCEIGLLWNTRRDKSKKNGKMEEKQTA
jgi:hypothetical protein